MSGKPKKMTFEEWFSAVDAECRKLYHLGIRDLPDCAFHDWYTDRKTPATAARKAWKLAQE